MSVYDKQPAVEDYATEMDADALKAAAALNDLDRESVKLVALWFKQWYMTAGHKRLGRILVKIAKES